VPSSTKAFLELVAKLASEFASGKSIAIHCRQGIGRAALVGICLLIVSGTGLEEATQAVSLARGCSVPETPEQRRWIADFSKRLVAHPPK
jgi:protein-tyrosine phosphatase